MKIDYGRQSAIPSFVVPDVLTVVGAGAVGSWAGYFAALGGVPRLLIYGMGKVKPTDIARLPFPASCVGKPYIYALPALIYSVRPEIELEVFEEFIPESSRLEGVVLNCAASPEEDFDTRTFRRASSTGLPYYSGGYDETSICVEQDVDPDTPPPALEPVPVWAGVAAATAALMVDRAFRQSRRSDRSFWLDLGVGTVRARGPGDTMGR